MGGSHPLAVTLRDVTERPETIEAGSNALAGVDAERVLTLVRLVTDGCARWSVPPEYKTPNVADIVSRILLGHRPEGRPADGMRR